MATVYQRHQGACACSLVRAKKDNPFLMRRVIPDELKDNGAFLRYKYKKRSRVFTGLELPVAVATPVPVAAPIAV